MTHNKKALVRPEQWQKYLAYQRGYYHKHPEHRARINERARKQTAELQNLIGNLKSKHPCHCCGSEKRIFFGHGIPQHYRRKKRKSQTVNAYREFLKNPERFWFLCEACNSASGDNMWCPTHHNYLGFPLLYSGQYVKELNGHTMEMNGLGH